MRILHVCNDNEQKWAGRYYAIDRKLSHGLIRLGHFVYTFSYRHTARYLSPLRSKHGGVAKMNRKLLETLDNLRPELLLLGHSELVDAATLELVKQRYPAIKIAMWYVDTMAQDKPQYVRQVAGVEQKMPYLDGFFATAAGSHLEVLQGLNRNCAVSFIPNMVDPSIESGRAFEADCQYDLCYIASSTLERESMIERIRQHYPQLNYCFRGVAGQPLVDGYEFIELLSNTAIGLNYSRYNSDYLSSSDRMAQLIGNGLATLSPTTPGMERLYTADEVCYFSDDDDLLEKIGWLQENPERRRQIAKAGWQRTHQMYSSHRIGQFMLDAIDGGESDFFNYSR